MPTIKERLADLEKRMAAIVGTAAKSDVDSLAARVTAIEADLGADSLAEPPELVLDHLAPVEA